MVDKNDGKGLFIEVWLLKHRYSQQQTECDAEVCVIRIICLHVTVLLAVEYTDFVD